MKEVTKVVTTRHVNDCHLLKWSLTRARAMFAYFEKSKAKTYRTPECISDTIKTKEVLQNIEKNASKLAISIIRSALGYINTLF